MTVKLVLLKSGETLISDVKEAFYDDKLVCYILEKPFVPVLDDPYDDENVVIDGQRETRYDVELFPWPVLSKDERIEIPQDWVLTMTAPIETLENIYNKRVLNKEEKENDQSIVFTEQSDSDQQD